MNLASTRIFLLVMVSSQSSIGCSFLLSEGSESDDGAEPDAGGMDANADTIDAAEADGASVDPSLVVQYFIDEDGVDELLRDQSNNQFDLPLDLSDGALAGYCEVGENQRGLCWDEISLGTRATRDVAGSGVAAALNGTTIATLEFVVALDGCDINGSRIMQVGPPDETFQGGLTLLCHQVDQLAFAFGNAKVVTDVPIAAGALIIHAVADTSLATPADRLKIYVNGAHVDVRDTTCGFGSLCGFAPLGAALNLDGYILTIGNRFNGDRSVSGSLTYGAIYDRALDSSAVLARSDVLSVSDDW